MNSVSATGGSDRVTQLSCHRNFVASRLVECPIQARNRWNGQSLPGRRGLRPVDHQAIVAGFSAVSPTLRGVQSDRETGSPNDPGAKVMRGACSSDRVRTRVASGL
jgi:hypothetical protein